MKNSSISARSKNIKVASVFIVVIMMIVLLGLITYYLEKDITENAVRTQLISIGKLKSDEIESWMNERKADIFVISQNEDFKETFNEYAENINTEKNFRKIKSRTDAFEYYNQYENIILLDKNNVMKYSLREIKNGISENTFKNVETAKAKKKIHFSNFYINEKNNNVNIDIAAPLIINNNYVGSFILVINPNKYFYPMLQQWPYQTETGENLLFKVENTEVVYLNEIRFKKNTAMKYTIPISSETEKILSVQAANGKEGLAEGKDYQQNEVLGYISKIKNTNWVLVTKINSAEAFANSKKVSIYSISLVILVVLIIGGSFYWIWKDKQRQTQEVFENTKLQEQYTRSLIEANLDPLVTISADGKITDVNEATIKITGETKESLIGTDFSNYFTEPHEARDGYLKVFREGFVKDYPLVLKHRSGKLTHVLYNASVYKDSQGNVKGVFAAARDITELNKAKEITIQQDWLKSGLVKINDVVRGIVDLKDFSNKVVSEIASYIDSKIGAFYVNTKNSEYHLLGSFAFSNSNLSSEVFKAREGLVGQAAIEKQQIVVKDVPDDYIKIKSGLGETVPKYIILTPIVYEGTVIAVLELGLLVELTEIQMQYLTEASRLIALSMAAVQNREKLDYELKRSLDLAEELQRQQEELKTSNEELEEQAVLLKQSEEKLKAQQEELQVSNEELESRNDSLEMQKREIEKARNDLKEKAEELALASKYKSEFLANMSHELRTPLNSLLILSKMLHDNRDGNLNKDQIESAGIIYNSGNDLLHLINEILDLSKIEAGMMDIQSENVYINELTENIRNNFKHVAEEKGLELLISTEDEIPEYIVSDRKRIEQILKNLISNSLKFTKEGKVEVFIFKPNQQIVFRNTDLTPDNSICIEIRDTGIGISKDKQKIIFEAFQQEDGGTSREYGGTGLGLSISKELTNLLGGEILLKSEKGKGTSFYLYLPKEIKIKENKKRRTVSHKSNTETKNSTETGTSHTADDRDNINKGDKIILIVEDSENFAKLLVNECRKKGFKSISAVSGEDGLILAEKYKPNAIILDIKLPGIDGYQVLEKLKENQETRHIPVHIMSVEDSTIEAYKKGAIGFLTKPPQKDALDEAFNKIIEITNKNMKNLLVAEDDKNLRESIVKLIGNGDVKTKAVSSGAEVLKELRESEYDCMIMDLGLSDITGFELLEKLEQEGIRIPPIIVYTGKDLTKEEEVHLRNYSDSIIIKGVKSEERLLDEASLFLHRIIEKMPAQKRKMIKNLYQTDEMFEEKKVMIVDDDMRNMFALSKILTQKGCKLIKAENGIKALELLKSEKEIDVILMDIMMPEMDGYETMQKIREQEEFFNIPIIALTAKAMKKDYEKCMKAGASDYLPKPVNIERLFSMLRVWLYR